MWKYISIIVFLNIFLNPNQCAKNYKNTVLEVRMFEACSANVCDKIRAYYMSQRKRKDRPKGRWYDVALVIWKLRIGKEKPSTEDSGRKSVNKP